METLFAKLLVSLQLLQVALAQAPATTTPNVLIQTTETQKAITLDSDFSNKAVPLLIKCESGGRNVKVLDTNGEYSFGILQFQTKTWNWWSKESGILGDPMNPITSIQMAHWAINNGYISHWSCAKKMGLLEKAGKYPFIP